MGTTTIIVLCVAVSTTLVVAQAHNGKSSAATCQLPHWSNANNGNTNMGRATNLHGRPVPSLTASQAIGQRGEVLLQDFTLIEKLAAFNRERIPERVVHAKGAGAFGNFVVTHDVTQYTKAKFLNQIGKETRVAVRFSTVGGSLGSADTAVDPHGFATKFYTEDGLYDLVGNNIETFPIRDPMLFADLNRSRKKNPQTNMGDQNMWWDFVSLRPESTFHTLHLFSDLGRPDGFRRMDGFSVHAFNLVNRTDGVVYGKLHWRTKQDKKTLTVEEAARLEGENPEYKTQDLFDAIANGTFPQWDLFLQIMTIEQANAHPANPFDITRTWREEDYPLIPVGTMTLNENPENYFAQIEQIAFAPSNMVPGIEPSPDRMLAGRLFSYQDAQRYRLGVNFPQIPVNKPLSDVTTYIRDGASCHGSNGGGSPNYHPNSFDGGNVDTEARQKEFQVQEGLVNRYDPNQQEEDNFAEPRTFLDRDVDPEHRERLVNAIADRLHRAAPEIRERVLNNNFYPVDETFGTEVRNAIARKLSQSK